MKGAIPLRAALVPPNDHVVAAFEEMLALAREGKLQAYAVVYETADQTTVEAFGGHGKLLAIIGSMACLQAKLVVISNEQNEG